MEQILQYIDTENKEITAIPECILIIRLQNFADNHPLHVAANEYVGKCHDICDTNILTSREQFSAYREARKQLATKVTQFLCS